MHRVNLILELADDEVQHVVDAVSASKVRFSSFRLGELLQMMRDELPEGREGQTVTHQVISDGLAFVGEKPLRWTPEPV